MFSILPWDDVFCFYLFILQAHYVEEDCNNISMSKHNFSIVWLHVRQRLISGYVSKLFFFIYALMYHSIVCYHLNHFINWIMRLRSNTFQITLILSFVYYGSLKSTSLPLDPEEVLSVSIPLEGPQRPLLGGSLILPCYFQVYCDYIEFIFARCPESVV